MKSLSPTFIIGSIQIGTIQEASCMNFGNNFPVDFKSQKKQNQGFGNITGDHNDIQRILARMSEEASSEYFIDLPADEKNEWLQKVMDSLQGVTIEQET